MKIKRFFNKKYIGYELLIYDYSIDEDRISYILNFYIDNNIINYVGLFTKDERKAIDNFYNKYKDLVIIGLEVDIEYKQIFIYLK